VELLTRFVFSGGGGGDGWTLLSVAAIVLNIFRCGEYLRQQAGLLCGFLGAAVAFSLNEESKVRVFQDKCFWTGRYSATKRCFLGAEVKEYGCAALQVKQEGHMCVMETSEETCCSAS
jgi:hypothetical protein